MFQDDFPLEMNLDDSKPIQPQVYKEPTMLCDLSSDSEFDDEDILLEELKKNSFQIPENEESSNATKNPNESKLKFIVPDFNYWNRNFVLTDPHRTPAKDINLKNLPKNFQWLIKTCASLLHMSPEILYVELMVIEYYYLYDLKPLELIENILKFQTPIDHKFRLYKQAWNENMRKRL